MLIGTPREMFLKLYLIQISNARRTMSNVRLQKIKQNIAGWYSHKNFKERVDFGGIWKNR